jgi:hypothetical protein
LYADIVTELAQFDNQKPRSRQHLKLIDCRTLISK